MRRIASFAVAIWVIASSAYAEAPPIAYQIFCIRFGGCDPGGAASIATTRGLMADLERVTKAVNASIRYRPDDGEVWKANVTAGDCEDYALTKRGRLIRMGYPPSALRMAIGHTQRGESHAVLVVKTMAGDFVLDNLTDRVLPSARANIRIRKMASADPRVWF
tara:strand:+ start:14805 stop:15293 length:489 start_codon:yes stop_codon:yes gene_type:complete